MTESDDNLLELADAVLDARPVDWTAIARTLPDTQRPLIDGFRSVASITSFHVESSQTFPTASEEAAPLIEVPSQWGPLTLIGFIGRGQFGDVYRARDPRLDRPVALKLLRRRDAEPDTAAEAVINEGRMMARVRHPNVVTIYGAERIDGRVGLLMELIDGDTLDVELRRHGPFPWEEACRIGTHLCEALAAVHRAGLLHRDLKAQNVLRESDGGRIVLADFGAGRMVSNDSTSQMGVAGTPLYLAPEIFGGAPATPASDVYSLGVLLFHLVTASFPIRGRTIAELREAHQQQRRSSLRTAHAHLPGRFTAIVERAIAPAPADRYTLDELGAALNLALREAQDGSRWNASGLVVRQRQWLAVAAAGAMLAAVTMMLYGLATGSGTEAQSVAHNADAPRLRKIRMPSFNVGAPSHDGAMFPYVDDEGRLQIWEVATNRSQLVVESKAANAAIGRTAASATAERVAYAWSLGEAGFELRVVNRDGTWPRVLIARQTAYEPVPVDWSRDGTALLCWLYQKNGSADLVSLPSEGGPLRVLHRVSAGRPGSARFSPDGRHVVTSAAQDGSATADVVVIDIGAATSRVVANAASADVPPVWLPDGSGVLFVRPSKEMADARDGWAVSIADGRPVGDPVLRVPNIGVGGIFVTTRGELYRALTTYNADVYIRTIDLTGTAEPGAPSRIAPNEVGNHVGPAWSPDGRSLAYFTIREPDIPGATPIRTLTIQNMVTGEVQPVLTPLSFLGGYTPRWSPDGKQIVVVGRDTADVARFGHYRVDLDTGRLEPVIITGDPSTPPFAEYARDGKEFFYMDPARGLVARAFATGRERVVIALEHGRGWRFAIAPDDHAIALIQQHQDGERWITALEVRQRGGGRRELVRSTTPRWIELHGWTPDSRNLIYAEGGSGEANRFFRISESGGAPIDLRFTNTPTPNAIALHPDGRRIAYAERVVERELWITPMPAAEATSKIAARAAALK